MLLFKAFKADSSHLENIIEIGDFCDNLNYQDKALHFYLKAIDNAVTDVVKTSLWIKVGHQFSYDNKFTKAEESYHRALEFSEQLAKEDMLKYGPLLADNQMALGRLYIELNDNERAMDNYLLSLELMHQLSSKNPDQYDIALAAIQLEVGGFYSQLMEFDLAENLYNQSLEIYNHHSSLDPNKYQNQLAAVYLGKAILLARNRKYTDAEINFLKAIDIYDDLMVNNPIQYEPQKASATMSLSVMYYHWGKYDKSEEGYKKTIAIYNRLITENPRRYEPSLAKTYLNLGSLYSTQSRYDLSEKMYLQSLKLRERLANENPKRFDPLLSHVLLNIAYMKKRRLYELFDMQQQSEALTYIAKAEDILDQYDNQLPWVQTYRADVKRFKSYLIGITKEDLLVQKRIDNTLDLEIKLQSENDLNIMISIQRQIIDSLNQIFIDFPVNRRLLLKMAEAYGSVAGYYLFNQQYEEAETSALKGLELDDSEAWINSYLALSLLYQNKHKKALKIYEKFIDFQYDGMEMRDIFIEDLDAMEQGGNDHKNNSKIRDYLTGRKK